MKGLKGSETEKNLLTAFAGESQARNRYTFFASKAKKEGYVQMSLIFEETANQEKEHAKRLFKFLEGGSVQVSAEFPAGVIGSTLENLKGAASGENYEWTEMYPGFAETARKEGIREGDWVVIESPRGRIRQRAKYFSGMDPRVVSAEHAWWYPEKSDSGHGWDESNINLLTRNDYENCDPAMGATHVRTLLCKVFPELA